MENNFLSPLGVSYFVVHCKGLGVFSLNKKYTDSHTCLHKVEILLVTCGNEIRPESGSWRWARDQVGHSTRAVGSAFI